VGRSVQALALHAREIGNQQISNLQSAMKYWYSRFLFERALALL